MPSPRKARSGRLTSSPDAHQTIWTVGHSNRPFENFLAAIEAHGIELIADVRSFPGSRRLPQFSSTALADHLARHSIGYVWLPALGGRRRPDPASRNTGWRHPAFRAYADYMATEDFADGLFELLLLAGGLRTALMCAEILWWRCHRRIVADVLTSLGVSVAHIRDEHDAEPHRLTDPARLVEGVLTYTPEDLQAGT